MLYGTNISKDLYWKIKDGFPNILNLPNEESSLLANGVEFRFISFFEAVLLKYEAVSGDPSASYSKGTGSLTKRGLQWPERLPDHSRPHSAEFINA